MRKQPPNQPNGLTLLELLVVMVIMTTLVATVIPVMVPSIENRRLREGARGLSTFLAGARSRAIKTGRPQGILIQRMLGEPGASTTLFHAEVPPPFAGLTTDATVRLQVVSNTEILAQFGSGYDPATFGSGASGDNAVPIPPEFVRVGDRLQVNYQGFEYQILGEDLPPPNRNRYVDGSKQLRLGVPVTSALGALPWPTSGWSLPMPYQIQRWPTSSSQTPYQLPDGIVVDLEASGLGIDPGVADFEWELNDNPIVITFFPNGSVDSLYHFHGPADPEVSRISRGVHLLIGKRENVPFPLNIDRTPENTNFLDPETLWVSISPQTGQIGTAENNAAQAIIAQMPSDQKALARGFAHEMQSMQGR